MATREQRLIEFHQSSNRMFMEQPLDDIAVRKVSWGRQECGSGVDDGSRQAALLGADSKMNRQRLFPLPPF